MAWAGRVRLIAGALALVALAVACVPEEPPPSPKVFVVYGDSLVAESMTALSGQLEVLLPGWEIRYQVWGGTAQCDFHASMVDDAANFNVGGVAIAFSGNNFTSCIQSRPYVEGYREDVEWAASFWGDRGVPLLFVAAPGHVGAEISDRPIPNVYLSVAAARQLVVADAAPLFAQGSPVVFTHEMPCLEGECASTIVARSPDGVHFCPVLGSEIGCPPAYSSGAVRYAELLAAGIANLLGVTSSLPRSMVTAPTTTSTTTTSPSTTSTTTTSTSTTTTAPPSPPTTTVTIP